MQYLTRRLYCLLSHHVVFVVCAAWFPNTLATAGAVIQYNLAVAFAIRGELDKAGETLKQVRSAVFLFFAFISLKLSVLKWTCMMFVSFLHAEWCPRSQFHHSHILINCFPLFLTKSPVQTILTCYYFCCSQVVIICVLTPCTMVRWVPAISIVR